MANEPKSKKETTNELLDELLNGEDPKGAFLNGSRIHDLKQAIADRALNAEMDVHLEQEEEQSSSNHRNHAGPVIFDGDVTSVGQPLHQRLCNVLAEIDPHKCRLPALSWA
jgi:hypothetical protein